jgi:ribosome-binding factor A
MSTRRTARVASVIREVISTAILQELRDPRIRNVTVLGVEVSADVRYAKVSISVMGTDQEASLTLHGLESARGYLQSKVAARVKTRYTPELRFEIDRGIQKSFETARILKEVLPESAAEEAEVVSGEPTSIEGTVVETDTPATDDLD